MAVQKFQMRDVVRIKGSTELRNVQAWYEVVNKYSVWIGGDATTQLIVPEDDLELVSSPSSEATGEPGFYPSSSIMGN